MRLPLKLALVAAGKSQRLVSRETGISESQLSVAGLRLGRAVNCGA